MLVINYLASTSAMEGLVSSPANNEPSTSNESQREGSPALIIIHEKRDMSQDRASSLSSGMLVTLGTMIAKSFILDGQGFPYLSEYCYYYLSGQSDKALTCIGERIRTLLQQVRLCVDLTCT